MPITDPNAPLYSPVTGPGTSVASGGRDYLFTGNSWTPTSFNTAPPAVGSEAFYNQPGQTLGAQAPAPTNNSGDGPAPTNNSGDGPAPTNNSGDGFDMSNYAGWDETAARANFAAEGAPQQGSGQSEVDRLNEQMRGQIEGGYNDYFAQLDSMLNEGLPGQRTVQEGIASSQRQSGLNTLGLQQSEGLSDLQSQRDATTKNQVSNLKDLASNLRNSFMAGNVYLGARGAGDSSAANQYSYALTKLGNKARGDVLSQSSDIQAEIGQRESKLKNLYNTEVKNLDEATDQKMLEIASWFGEQQNSLRTAKGQGQLSKGQDLASLSQTMLDQALNQIRTIEQEASNRRTALNEWALNNSNSINEAKANLQGVGSFNPAQPQSRGIAGTPQIDASGNLKTAALGYGSSDEEKRLGG